MSRAPKGTIISLLTEADLTRRSILRQIEKITGTRVIAYLANPNASPNFIDHNDPIFFNDLLEAVGHVDSLDLVIDSPGGEANIAEKLAFMCREHCKVFRTIVPNSAKSAATMLTLASDVLLMGYLSEIGPIDPQVRVVSPSGQITFVPAQSIIDSVGMLHNMLQQGIDQRAVITLMQKLDPAMIDVANKAIQFSRQFAKDWLSRYMLKDNAQKAEEIATALSDNRRWLSHGKRIGAKESQELGLNVQLIDRNSELWKLLWQYYSRAQIHLNNTGTIKLFECKELGLNFGIRVGRPPTPSRPTQSPELPE